MVRRPEMDRWVLWVMGHTSICSGGVVVGESATPSGAAWFAAVDRQQPSSSELRPKRTPVLTKMGADEPWRAPRGVGARPGRTGRTLALQTVDSGCLGSQARR